MDTIRVDISYRPLRIGWAIREGDLDAFRTAVRLSYTFWGGRYNPIIPVDREEEAKRLVDIFRVDMICEIGNTNEVKSFPAKFPHLITPFFPNALIVEGLHGRKHGRVLDIHNAVAHLADSPEWKAAKDQGVCLYS
jgi:hypothetical protein